ncbi:MAG: glycosyltransferase family 2 protein [Caulobacteraceae bacterium]
MSAHVAVAIVAFRNLEDVRTCLEALAASTHGDFEVVICENGGEGAFSRLAAALPRRLVSGQGVRAIDAGINLGFAGGVNLCLAAAPDADAWWVLNPDTRPEPEAMAAQLRRLAAGDCEAVGCTLYLPDGRVQSYGGRWRAWLARAVSIGHGRALAPPPAPAAIERTQNYLNGASMMIGRRFLETVGPMREDYFLYGEEVEWCLRALARGMRLGFAPDARVLHFQGTTTGNIPEIARRARMPIHLNERNRILVTRDRFPARLPVVALAALATVFLRYPRRGAWRQLRWALQGWLAGVRGERGRPPWAET